MLQKSGILFDEVHTSLLRRSIRTVNLTLMEMGQEYIPVHKHWRLNERNYGALVGHNKKQVVKLHGQDQVRRWRRSYDEPPPPMQDDHEFHPKRDPRYRHVSFVLGGLSVNARPCIPFSLTSRCQPLIHSLDELEQMLDQIPSSESLKCTLARSRVYWDEAIAPALHEGKTILIVGHENNLRSLIMRLEGISEEDIINLNLPRAVPLAYRLDENLKPMDRKDGKLDEATGFLRGEWLGGDDAVAKILDRDHKQVYDTTIEANLEKDKHREKWNTWMEFEPAPYLIPSRYDPIQVNGMDDEEEHEQKVAQ